VISQKPDVWEEFIGTTFDKGVEQKLRRFIQPFIEKNWNQF
jgi:hypothetical protein